ncbi:GGDEF domain-containing protein [Marinicella rhabdoformis]|uniref:GGDEF domain-containing protein n=1 Tax=Marinicella rhabdoformis TaxID=2580566 RepID=UPI0012AEBB23|nr:GGDEF domain-containing protein [Marinicella rhabdoformis]
MQKTIIIIVTVLCSLGFSAWMFEPVKDIRFFNLLTESFTAIMAVFFYFKVDDLKDKPYHPYLSWGFYLAFVALLADSFDQLYYHGEVYTAIIEKSLKLLGYAFVFIGVKKWLEEYQSLNVALTRQAIRDGLTGLYNRRGMQRQLEKIHEVAHKNNETYAVIIIDFDDFKVINDTYGHVAGDEVLSKAGQSLLAFLSDSQKVGRWGGEEFAIVELGVGVDEAAETCENIRIHLSEINMSGSIQDHQVTLSFGVSQCKGKEPYMEVVKRADRALYQSKTAGKNCVTVL